MTTRYSFQPRHLNVGALLAAVMTTMGVLGAIVMMVENATSTPWLPAEQAGLIRHCDAMTASTERRACVHAAVAWRDQTRVAAAHR